MLRFGAQWGWDACDYVLLQLEVYGVWNVGDNAQEGVV
jgi:hypothetical protein